MKPASVSHKLHEGFRRFSAAVATAVGTPWAFVAGVIVTLAWFLCGPVFHYSDTWQLVINTGTTIATFLMVFLIQNTQNRDARAIHLKLDELIRSAKGARNRLVELENCSDEELLQLKKEFERIRQRSGKHGGGHVHDHIPANEIGTAKAPPPEAPVQPLDRNDGGRSESTAAP